MIRFNQFYLLLASRDGAPAFVMVAVLFFLLATGREGTARQLSTENFKTAGITLGVTTNYDLKRILGPAPAMDTPDDEGARRCYLSASGYGTVLEIESWVGTVIEFRLDSRPDATENRCARSPLVSSKLADRSRAEIGPGSQAGCRDSGASDKRQRIESGVQAVV